jgi:HD-like signal output (HDOD) protein
MMESKMVNWTLENINSQTHNVAPPMDMREAISKIKALPPLPGSATRILNLLSDPNASVEKLVEIIELDPLLTAQIIRWASSALYGYRGKITSVHEAITRVLGFNFVLDLALGLAVLAPLKAPVTGKIGTRMFWIHALASTRLMQQLNEKLSEEMRLPRQEVFLAGLMHNIGFPLFGHEFPEEFVYLDKLVDANPLLIIYNLETFSFGVNHAEIGAWLMNAWSMPNAITDVVYHHHNPHYRGKNYRLNLLTYLNDCLLGQIDIGDGVNQICPDDAWQHLGLDFAHSQELIANQQEELEKIVATAEMLTEKN